MNDEENETTLYTGTAKYFYILQQHKGKLKVKPKQNIQRPDIPDLGQAQKMRRG